MCKSEFRHDPSGRTLKCELHTHKGWHENGTTLWTDQDLTIIPRRRSRYDGSVEQAPTPAREKTK